MPGKRNEYIDSVKGIAIILVVVGHCVQYGSGQDYFTGGTFFSDALFKFIYGFHMPLFMAISGYLFYFSISRKAKEIVIGKLRGVLLPLFSWHTLYQVLLIVFGVSITVPTFIYSYFHTLWFLRALFFCCMLTLIVNRIFQDKVYAHLLVCCLLYLIPNRIIPDVFVFTSTFFTLGYLFNQYHIIQRLYTDSPKILHITAIILSAIYFVLLAYYQTCYYVYLSGAYLFSKNYSLPQMLFINLYRNFTAVCGCVMILYLLFVLRKHIQETVLSALLTKLSVASLSIYIVNHYMNETILLMIPCSYINYLITILETTIVIAIGYFAYILCKRNRITKVLFLGGR